MRTPGTIGICKRTVDRKKIQRFINGELETENDTYIYRLGSIIL